jgi:TonB family protein
MRPLFAALFVAFAAVGQEPAATRFKLFGTVLDPMNRGIPGASVTLIAAGNEKKQQIKSDTQGRFEFNDLPAGRYSLDARQPGFRNATTPVEVAGSDVHSPLTMTLGGLEETIKVSARNAGARPQLRDQPQNVRMAGERCVDPGTGGVIRPPLKLTHVVPAYPVLMLESRIEGTVILTGQLAADGSPLNLKAVGTPNVGLTAAAMDAARQTRFAPVLLNCAPTPIDMTLTFVFSLR